MEQLSGHDFWVRRCAAICLLMYLTYDVPDGTTVSELFRAAQKEFREIKEQDHRYCDEKTRDRFGKILAADPSLGAMTIDCQSVQMGYSKNGLNAAVFFGCEFPIVAFRGTADGEWNDNAVALIGEKYTNTYYHYGADGIPNGAFILEEYVSTQQAQALDYFRRVAKIKGWEQPDSIVVTGHSKGGNKTQFITLRSPLIKNGFSFCGQGFSREALEDHECLLGAEEFHKRRRKIFSVSANNDFVNVLGDRFIPEDQIHFVAIEEVSYIREYHECMSLLNDDGTIREYCEFGELSELARDLWQDVRQSPERGAIAMAAMSLFEQMLGNGIPINGEIISYRSMFLGGTLATGMAMKAMASMMMQIGLKKLPEKFVAGVQKYIEWIRPHADSVILALAGTLDKTLEKFNLKRAADKETKSELHIGAAENSFSVDVDVLKQAADRLQVLAEAIQEAGKDSNAHDEAAQKLLVYAGKIREIAEGFEETDRSLAGLVDWVLKGKAV